VPKSSNIMLTMPLATRSTYYVYKTYIKYVLKCSYIYLKWIGHDSDIEARIILLV